MSKKYELTNITKISEGKYKNKLTEAYCEINGDLSYKELVLKLNVKLSTNMRVQRLMDWRNGSRKIPRKAGNYMRSEVLRFIYKDDCEDLIILLSLDAIDS